MSNARKFVHRKRTPPRKQVAHREIVTMSGNRCEVKIFDSCHNSGNERRLYTDVQWDDTASAADKLEVEAMVQEFLNAIAPGRNRLIALSIDDEAAREDIVNRHFRGEYV